MRRLLPMRVLPMSSTQPSARDDETARPFRETEILGSQLARRTAETTDIAPLKFAVAKRRFDKKLTSKRNRSSRPARASGFEVCAKTFHPN